LLSVPVKNNHLSKAIPEISNQMLMLQEKLNTRKITGLLI